MLKHTVDKYKQNNFIESHRFLLIYAHVIALIHGVGFITQGNVILEGTIKHALLNTNAWHGGLPAISLFNISLLIGISTVLLSIISMYLILSKFHSKFHWFFLFAIFVSGGGFVYFFISCITRISLSIRVKNQDGNSTFLGESFLIVLFLWMFSSWILGLTFPLVMLRINLILFVLFDVSIPVIIIWLHRHQRVYII